MMVILKVMAWALGSLILLATLPGTLEILLVTLGCARKAKRTGAAKPRSCRLAVVIPAHNEATLIGKCVASVSTSAHSIDNAEIVVVADNCTDDTAARAAAAGAQVLTREDPERRGKGYALQLAFDQLRAQGFNAFLVIDADSVVSPNLIREVLRRLESGASAVQCRYRVTNPTASLRTRLMDVALLAFNVLRLRGRAGWGLSSGIVGNGFALRDEILQRIPFDATSIVEDLEYHLRLVIRSEQVEFIDEATVFGEIPSGDRAARVQRSRWEGGRLRMAKAWVPQLLSRITRGEWRLAEPLLELLTLPLAYQVLLLLGALALPEPFREYAAAAFGLVIVHVLVATLLGERPWQSVLALAAAPFYIVWKITTLGAVYAASRKDARWLRTGRESAVGLGAVE